MTTQLVRYEQARTALAACHSVDEVKEIRDKAEAMAAYARLAKDTDMIQWATEIKVRAERQAGGMLAEAKSRGELASHGGDRKSASSSQATTLKAVGITADQSSRWQSLASMTDAHFETAVATAKDTAGQVTTAFMLREAKTHRAAPIKTAKAEQQREQLKAALGGSQLLVYIRALMKALEQQQELSDAETQAITELREQINQLLEVETT